MKLTVGQMIPLTELQRRPGRIMRRLADSPEPLLILDRGKPAALLLDYKRYETIVAGDERKQELLKALEEMIPLLIEGYQPEKIVLFGSLARDLVTSDSDIDLCVIKETRKRPIERRRELVRLLRPTVATDFFVYSPSEIKKAIRDNRPFFVDEIMKEGKVLYEKAG